MRGENLEQADHAEIRNNGRSQNRANAECAAKLGIYPRVRVRIFAENALASAHAFAGKTFLHIHFRTRRRRGIAGAPAAHHSSIGQKRKSGTARARKRHRALGNELANGIRVVFAAFHIAGPDFAHLATDII